MSFLPNNCLRLLPALLLAFPASQAVQRAQGQQTLETPALRLAVSPASCSYEITDKRSRVAWKSNPYVQRFGSAVVTVDGKEQTLPLGPCDIAREGGGLALTFHPLAGTPAAWLRVAVRADADSLSRATRNPKTWPCRASTCSRTRCGPPDLKEGYALVPVRMGLMIPADSGLTFTQTFGTYEYEGFHMAMLGLVKQGVRGARHLGRPLREQHSEKRSCPLAARWRPTGPLGVDEPAEVGAVGFSIHLLGRRRLPDHRAEPIARLRRKRGLVETWDVKIKRIPRAPS